MTNKDYKRLTVWNDQLQRPCMTSEGSNEQTVDVVRRHIDRLYELENAIENGTLFFLPCKVGDEFWYFAEYYRLSDGWVYEIAKHTVQEIQILNKVIYLYDECDNEYNASDVILYATKEAAKKCWRK